MISFFPLLWSTYSVCFNFVSCTTRSTALFSAHIHLTFVQERPIGFGIKNNLGSLFDFLLQCIFVYLLHKLFREVYHFSYSFLHCMLLALAWSKFSIELEKYLLTWFFFLLTYVWNFVTLASGWWCEIDPFSSCFLLVSFFLFFAWYDDRLLLVVYCLRVFEFHFLRDITSMPRTH